MRNIKFIWLAALGVALFAGCRKSEPVSTSSAGPSPENEPASFTASSIHWIGRKQLESQSNAAGLLRIWHEPEAEALEKHTLDRLAQAPWRLLRGESGTNAASALLRPLLDDLVQEESYVEISHETNGPGAMALAIRLSEERAALWETNLAAVFESLTGIRPEAGTTGRPGWSLTKHHAPNHLELTRAGAWTIVGVGQGTNVLLADFLARIHRSSAPFVGATSNVWLDANLDLRSTREALALDWNVPTNVAGVTLAVGGDGTHVLTRGELKFSRVLPLALEPWMVPTNLITVRVDSFTALRGVAPLLSTLITWQSLQCGPPPNQIFVWSGVGVPFQTLFAAPVPNASNRMAQLNEILLSRFGQWLSTNDSGRLEKAANSDGVAWTTVPFMSPYLHSDGDFLLGGFFPAGRVSRPLPAELMEIMNHPNVVYCDWEVTGPRIEGWLQLGQLLRLVLHKSQLPGTSPSTSFLLANTNRLGPALTVVSQSAPGRLTLTRQSAVGLTSVEMHLLADWLESPEFPRGLNTLLGQQVWIRNRRPPQLPQVDR